MAATEHRPQRIEPPMDAKTRTGGREFHSFTPIKGLKARQTIAQGNAPGYIVKKFQALTGRQKVNRERREPHELKSPRRNAKAAKIFNR